MSRMLCYHLGPTTSARTHALLPSRSNSMESLLADWPDSGFTLLRFLRSSGTFESRRPRYHVRQNLEKQFLPVREKNKRNSRVLPNTIVFARRANVTRTIVKRYLRDQFTCYQLLLLSIGVIWRSWSASSYPDSMARLGAFVCRVAKTLAHPSLSKRLVFKMAYCLFFNYYNLSFDVEYITRVRTKFN